MKLSEMTMKWKCPYCKNENTDTVMDLDYGTVLCQKCEKPSDVYFDLQPINVVVKGVD